MFIRSDRLYIIGLIILFAIVFSYIFNEKIDFNGDNCAYYALATSLSEGHGYSNIIDNSYSPSNVFPPGYPILMSGLRFFTDSIFLQKILNGLFLLFSSILMFFFLKKNKASSSLAFIASAAMLLNYQVLHFSTMMMSEMSFLLFSLLTLWFISKVDEKEPFWKNPFFYLSILTAAYGYHIRTQGIALIAAIFLFYLFTKKWKQAITFGGGIIICSLPWMIRNNLLNLGQSRYLSQIVMENTWRPENGTLEISGIISRFFDTLRMLITQAMPDSVLPYIASDYGKTSLSAWCIAILLCVIILIGFWQINKYKYLFLFYTAATLGIISLFNAPSGNRYITTLLPLLDMGLLVGLYAILSKGMKRLKITRSISPWLLVPLFLFFSFPRIQTLHANNKYPYPPNYLNFFKIAEEVHKQLPPETVVCSRKPELFYMYSKTTCVGYNWTDNAEELIKGLIQANTDYVILEQLGYSSTGRYLYPAIEKNSELFPIVMHLKNPDTYLLKFERENAIKKFNYNKP